MEQLVAAVIAGSSARRIAFEADHVSVTNLRRLEQALPAYTYKVHLNENGKLRWIGYQDGEEEIWKKDPQTGWWRRFQVSFMRILPIKGQL